MRRAFLLSILGRGWWVVGRGWWVVGGGLEGGDGRGLGGAFVGGMGGCAVGAALRWNRRRWVVRGWGGGVVDGGSGMAQ